MNKEENKQFKDNWDKLKKIHARYCIPASEQNYTDKDYACMQYEKLVIHLQKEIERLNNIIKEVREYIKNNTYKIEWGDLEQDNEDININEDLTDKEFIENLLEILDKENK